MMAILVGLAVWVVLAAVAAGLYAGMRALVRDDFRAGVWDDAIDQWAAFSEVFRSSVPASSAPIPGGTGGAGRADRTRTPPPGVPRHPPVHPAAPDGPTTKGGPT